MIDTHAHIDSKQYDHDREETIRRAFDNGVEKIINVGADMEGSIGSVELAENYENIYASIGLHPHVFNDVGEFPISKIFSDIYELVKNKKVVAIGEIGLDYFSHTGEAISDDQKESQKKGFIDQIKIAKESNLPVIIHCRDAYDECFEIIKNYPDQKFVFHCYGGSMEFTKKLLNRKNINFSFTGNITYAKLGSEIFDVVKSIPLERIMLETDCPYLAPVPYRGKRNEPAYVHLVSEKIAEIKEISAKKVEEITTENAKSFFGF